LALGTEFVEDI